MTNAPDIAIPRLEEESAKAYAARVEYITLGAGRSLEKIVDRAQTAPKPRPTQRLATLKEWSSAYEWVEHARRYDDMLASLAMQDYAEQYRKDLEDHRARYQKAGKDLYTVAVSLIGQCAAHLRGRQIEDKNGNVHVIPAMEITPNTLAIASRALTTAGDLEAHALRIADILPKLSHDESD